MSEQEKQELIEKFAKTTDQEIVSFMLDLGRLVYIMHNKEPITFETHDGLIQMVVDIREMEQVSEALKNRIKEAIDGLSSDQLKDFIGKLPEGFIHPDVRDEYAK